MTSNLYNDKEKSFTKKLLVFLILVILFIGIINFCIRDKNDSKLNRINNIKQENNEDKSTILESENNSNTLGEVNDIREDYNLKRV